MKKITVLGNFSGRNAGDAAILGCLLDDVTSAIQDVEFYIPTINTKFVRQSFSEYPVRPVSLMPWNLSAKILGVPVFRATLGADLVLVTDAILFDRKLFNPLFNYLWTLSHLLPRAKAKGIPVVLYNCSLGPITREAGKKALERVIASSELLILRDKESMRVLEKLDLRHDGIIEGADCALNSKPAAPERFREICNRENLFDGQRPVIGFNVNSYIDAFVRKDGRSFGREKLIELFAVTVEQMISKHDVDVIFIETQHMDLAIAQQVIERIRQKDRIRLVTNRVYSYRDICAVLQKLDMLVGMRTHSLILSSAMGTPPVGIVTYPKNRGYMQTIGLERNLIEFRDLSVEKFFTLISDAFVNRAHIRAQMLPHVQREQAKARQSAELLRRFLA